MHSLKTQAMDELLTLARNLNRVQMTIEMFPPDVEGPRPVNISTYGNGAMTYSAGEDMRHMPALLKAFGNDGWSLQQTHERHFLIKTTKTGVGIYVENIDPLSDALPKGCTRLIIPQVEHSLS